MKSLWCAFKLKLNKLVGRKKSENSGCDASAMEQQPRQEEELPDQREENKGISSALPHTPPRFVAVTPKYQRRKWHKPLVFILSTLVMALTFGLVSLLIQLVDKRNAPVEICRTTECLRAAATIRMNLDLTADPCQDFYQYACGNWAEEHPKPETASQNDWFSERQVRVSQNLRTFLRQNNSQNANEPLPVKQTRTLYSACMDTDGMNSAGYVAVEHFMRKIGFPTVPQFFTGDAESFNNGTATAKLLGRIKRYYGKDILIGWDVYPDPRNRSAYRMAVGTPEPNGGLPLVEQYAKHIHKFRSEVASKEDGKMTARDKEIIDAYYVFIREAIGEYLTTTTQVKPTPEQLQEASEQIYMVTKYVYKKNQQVENMNKSENPLEDIFDISIPDLQNLTNAYANNATGGNVTELPFWAVYLEEIFRDSPEVKLDVSQEILLTSRMDMAYLKGVLGNVVAKQSQEVVELYIWWTLLEDMMLYTTDQMRNLHRSYLKTVSGIAAAPSRSLYCTTVVSQMMGMAMSYGIAEPEFLWKTKPKVTEMLIFIRNSFEQLVRELHWMDQMTKAETLAKVRRMQSLIGFPEWILNKTALETHYFGIQINESDYLGTMLNLLDREIKNNTAKLRLPQVTQWATTPTNVNAFHTFQSNAITIPLAILQFPFYHLGLESLNYGAIGTILGHELTHGFDDSGRHYDKNGNMQQWWTNQTISEYINRTKCFVEQYNGFTVQEINEKINGERTLGENIADNGGIREAFMAYKMYSKIYGKEATLPGFENYTAEQLFFLSFGNLWCETTTAASLRYAIEDSHCPGRIRLTGVLSNFPDFAAAFKCRPGDKMVSKNMCRIW